MLKISSLDIAGNCASLGFTTKQWLCFLMSFDSNSKENIYDQVLFFNWLFSSASQIIEKQEEIVQLCNQSNEGGQVRAIEDVVKKCLYSVHVVQILSCLKQYSNSQIWHIIFQQQKLHLIHLQWLLMNLFIFPPPQSTRDNAMRLFSFLLSCVVAARWFQPAGFRSGLSAAHMPTHREDRKAAGSQPPAAEADLQPAEERQDDQDQRGARSFLPLLVMVVGVQCTLYSYSYFHCSRLPPIRVWVPITSISDAKRQNQQQSPERRSHWTLNIIEGVQNVFLTHFIGSEEISTLIN